MSVAAATSASRQRKAAKRAQALAIQRRQLSERRKALKERANEVFDKMTTITVANGDGGEKWLLESQIQEFLEECLSIKQPKVLQPDAVQLVKDTAHRQQIKLNHIPPADKPDAFSKEALINSIEKYGEYIQKVKKIDTIFHKYDKEKDGELNRDELLRVLQDRERKMNRAKNGIVIRLIITPEDINWIMEQCDNDQTGSINHAEYLPAIAAWEELAQIKMEQKTNICCIIL